MPKQPTDIPEMSLEQFKDMMSLQGDPSHANDCMDRWIHLEKAIVPTMSFLTVLILLSINPGKSIISIMDLAFQEGYKKCQADMTEFLASDKKEN